MLRRCLTLEEAERVLNDYHSGACGGHMSGYATAQNILRASYLWPSIFKDYIVAVRKFHACQVFQCKMCTPPLPLHRVITVGHFSKWGVDFMTCNPRSTRGHAYIMLLWTTSLSGPKRCLHQLPMVRQPLNSFSTMLLRVLESLKPFSPIMALIFRIT